MVGFAPDLTSLHAQQVPSQVAHHLAHHRRVAVRVEEQRGADRVAAVSRPEVGGAQHPQHPGNATGQLVDRREALLVLGSPREYDELGRHVRDMLGDFCDRTSHVYSGTPDLLPENRLRGSGSLGVVVQGEKEHAFRGVSRLDVQVDLPVEEVQDEGDTWPGQVEAFKQHLVVQLVQ